MNAGHNTLDRNPEELRIVGQRCAYMGRLRTNLGHHDQKLHCIPQLFAPFAVQLRPPVSDDAKCPLCWVEVKAQRNGLPSDSTKERNGPSKPMCASFGKRNQRQDIRALDFNLRTIERPLERRKSLWHRDIQCTLFGRPVQGVRQKRHALLDNCADPRRSQPGYLSHLSAALSVSSERNPKGDHNGAHRSNSGSNVPKIFAGRRLPRGCNPKAADEAKDQCCYPFLMSLYKRHSRAPCVCWLNYAPANPEAKAQ